MTGHVDEQGRRFHGRRHGRPLRPGQKQLLDRDLPRLAVPVPEAGTSLDPTALFGRPVRDVWLEIGFGGGEHLAWQAEQHRDIGFIGCEPFVNGQATLLRAVRDRDLDNIRVFAEDARFLLDALPANSLGRVFILFPDPWPKTRHHRRRIIQHPVLDRLAVLMRPGAELRLATDHVGYLRWMLAHMIRRPDFTWLAQGPDDWRQRPDDWPPTRYETKAVQQGIRCTYLRYRR